MKVKSKIDVITNSSSEVYCIIKGDDKEILEKLHGDLVEIFGWRQEREQDIVADFTDEDITIDFPYHLNKFKPFYKAGLEELIKNYSGTHIEYVDEEL